MRLKTILAVLIGLFLPRTTSANLIANGDFEDGNVSFHTHYTFNGIGDSAYVIEDDPQDWNPNFASFGDHTTGTGLMMVVNGSIFSDLIVWEETVSVIPFVDYTLSVWTASAHFTAPAELDFLINGTSVGSKPLDLGNGVWSEFSVLWNSGSMTSANIRIIDLEDAHTGNDFVLDDISFVPEPSAGLLFMMAAFGLLCRQRDCRFCESAHLETHRP